MRLHVQFGHFHSKKTRIEWMSNIFAGILEDGLTIEGSPLDQNNHQKVARFILKYLTLPYLGA